MTFWMLCGALLLALVAWLVRRRWLSAGTLIALPIIAGTTYALGDCGSCVFIGATWAYLLITGSLFR